ncbi:hypothetical protein WJX75_002382 [Coccomyxa subellipsoidea]|uniref:Uncharacterized protein n=1 Tax=Coccomyxa subellipsoidea TaxID=248742 RepID=A0ABR2YPM8_9CHLO
MRERREAAAGFRAKESGSLFRAGSAAAAQQKVERALTTDSTQDQLDKASGSISRPEDSTNDLASPLSPTAQQAAITVVDDKIEVRVDSKSLVSRLLPKIKTRTKSGNSDVKSRSNVQEASHGRNKISMCCFGGS